MSKHTFLSSTNVKSAEATLRRGLARMLQAFFVLVFLTSAVGTSTAVAAGDLEVVSAGPTGGNVPLSSTIEIIFNQPIQSTTLGGSINSAPLVSTQVVVSSDGLNVTIDPGELEYGKTYAVVLSGTVATIGDPSTTLGDDYAFEFTTAANTNSKHPTTSVNVPLTSLEAGQTYTISGQASGYIWQRDADNPLELELYGADGSLAGTSGMLHPTALYIPEGIDGYKYWLIYTGTGGSLENPNLMRSTDGVNFSSAGITNPVVTYNFQPPYDTMNLADPEIYRVGKTWMLFYEQEALSEDVLPYMGTGGNIGLALSSDGVNWEPYGGAYAYNPLDHPTDFPANGNPVVKPPTPTSTGYRSGEMAVIFKDGLYHMWRTVIDSGLFIDHDTATDPRGPWTLQTDKLDMGGYEYGPHPDVVYDPERNLYLMMYLIPSGDNVGQLGLYTSSSVNGPWTLHPISPVFSAQATGWEASRLYHSSMVQVGTQWYLYYTGGMSGGQPQIGLAREVSGVRRVEVSTNGGTAWVPATLASDGSWTYSWTPTQAGTFDVQARVVDDFMQGDPTAPVSVPVSGGALPTAQAPILVITDASFVSNPFASYLTEILKAEGITEFQQVQLGSLMSNSAPLDYLNNFSVVLLAQSAPNSASRQLLSDYVAGGGTLIAMRPDPAMADLFGLTYVSARPEQNLEFFAIDASSEAGAGIVGGSLQYHGAADNYAMSGASALAYLWNSVSTPSSNPAVTIKNVGIGTAVAFTFDLAKSIVMMRQGNPAWKDTEGDGLGGYRPMDMFERSGGSAWWIAGDKMRIPQADEEQRFLANLILTSSKQPMPRMWYLPGDHTSVFISTGDAEGDGGTNLNPPMDDIARYGGHYTNYLMEAGIASTDPALEASWRAAGNEVGPHVYGGGPDTCEALTPAYAQIAADILAKFGHPARTARSHTIDWCGWSDMAEIEANNGTELDTNYYHYNNDLLQYGANANGYFTGSGMPQLFMNEQGRMLSIYQATTEFPDEWFADSGQGPTVATQTIEDMIQAAENGNYSAFVANIHHVRYSSSDGTHTWANNIWAYAQAHNVPLWSAENLLDFVKARNASRFDNLTFSNAVLSFDYVPGAARSDLSIMVPASHAGNGLLSVDVGTQRQTLHIVTVKGLDYARFAAPSTNALVVATYGVDTTAPAISAVQANGVTDISASIAWQTDELGSSRVDYGPDAAHLNQTITAAGNASAHSVALSGLSPMTTYRYRVTSIDRSGNSSSSDVYEFTTSKARWVETTTADFTDGVLTGTQVTSTSGGEITLGNGAVTDNFDGTSLNTTTWFARNLFGGDPVVSVSDGQVTVSSGTYVRTNQTYFQNTLEGYVTLRSGPNAHFGFADTVNSGDDGIVDPSWMIFSSVNGVISARTRLNDGQGVAEEINTPLSGVAVDVPHLFKIVWNTDDTIEFWVDGQLKTTHTRNFTQPFRVYITSNSAQSTSAEWVSIVSDYMTSGTYQSSAFDSGEVSHFDTLTWTGSTPAGTVAAFETRTSDDGAAWSDWQQVGSGGAIDSPAGQFIQYRASLSTSNIGLSPSIGEVVVTYEPAGPDTTPPSIVSVSPASNATGVAIGTNITIIFSEPIDSTTFAATVNGATAFVAAYQNGYRTVILDPTVNFDPATVVTVRVSGEVKDRAGLALAAPYQWSFMTSDQSPGWVETTVDDFSDGTLQNVLISNAGGGELRLMPDLMDDFNGSALGAGWVSGLWAGGAYAPTIDAGVMTNATQNSYVRSIRTFGTDVTVEARIKFETGGNANAPYMYFGLAGTNFAPWAAIGTGYTGDQVYISTYAGRPTDPATVGLGNLFGAWHDYRITYKTNQVEYYVDGVLRHTETVSIPGPLYIWMHHGGAPSGASIAADWVRVDRYSTVQQAQSEFSDDFSGADLNWDSLSNRVSPEPPDFHIAGGKLVHGTAGLSYHPVLPRNIGASSQFELNVDADSPDGFWALAWGLQDNAHYYMAQSYGGTFAVFRLDDWFDNYTRIASFPAPGIVAGTPQHIRLVGDNGTYTVYVDGNQIGTLYDATYATGKVGLVGYGGFVTNFDNASLVGTMSTVIPGGSATYTSNANDFGGTRLWGALTWTGQTPAGTRVQFATRSSLDNVTWSDWADLDGSGNIASPASRYLQYRGQLASTDLNLSPVVEEVVVNSSAPPVTYSLTVSTIGNGTVTSAPVGINCGVTCSAAYSYGTGVTLTAAPLSGWIFSGWSGACSGTGACVVTMDGDKNVTANLREAASVLISPSGTPVSWDGTFQWTGVTGASMYYVQILKADDTNVSTRWYYATSDCTGTNCGVTPEVGSLPNGDYKWRVLDWGGYGYGAWTEFTPFTLNAACYTLTSNVLPGGSGTLNATAPNCGAGYSAGTLVQVNAVPNSGYLFSSWSGDVTGTTNPVSFTMDGDKTVTANLREVAAVLISPSGTPVSWDGTFQWTGVTGASMYYVQILKADDTNVSTRWYYAASDCTGTNCGVTPDVGSLANGDYKWRVLDWGGYGYGAWTEFTDFTLNAACYTLTSNVLPGGSGTLNATAPNCGAGYSAGTLVQVNAVPNSGYLFSSWSGDVTGTTNPVSFTMDGDKSVTANLREVAAVLISPSGTPVSWDGTFQWTGVTGASMYYVQILKADDTNVSTRWYYAASDCTGTNCGVTPEVGSLPNGDYKWRVLDWGGYGYGAWTEFTAFTLNAACYTLTSNVLPVGSGTLNATAPNCGAGYSAGTLVQVNAVPNSGYLFSSWSGDVTGTTNPISITMNGDKTVTANLREVAAVLISPSGTPVSWDGTFQWTGVTGASMYYVQILKADDTNVSTRWYYAASDCTGTNCGVTPEVGSLANGDYKWRVLDWGGYGYGAWTEFTDFTLNAACYTLTSNVLPGGSGTLNATAPNCGAGYSAGTLVQVNAVPNSGYLFSSWSGDVTGTTNPVSFTMDGDKSVTANLREVAAVLISPSGTPVSWDGTFQWTGVTGASMYYVQILKADDTNVSTRWYYAASDCTGTNCGVTPDVGSLPNGDYKWRVLDWGGYGYGAWTEFTSFQIP